MATGNFGKPQSAWNSNASQWTIIKKNWIWNEMNVWNERHQNPNSKQTNIRVAYRINKIALTSNRSVKCSQSTDQSQISSNTNAIIWMWYGLKYRSTMEKKRSHLTIKLADREKERRIRKVLKSNRFINILIEQISFNSGDCPSFLVIYSKPFESSDKIGQSAK